MHVFKVLLCVASLCVCHAAAQADATFTSPQNFHQLRDYLSNLGIPDVQSLYSPQTSHSGTNPPNPSGGCAVACDRLGHILQSNVSQAGSQTYTQEQKYWSAQQAETQPRCRVSPKNPPEVAATVLITTYFRCPFAVKSGGHAAFKGASNIQGGITIDLINLNQLQVAADKTLTRVGAGNRWIDVYSKLDLQQLSVLGGRVADLGVGGLTLGGGISFFSGRRGWACDGVRNFEVVLASGQIVNVDQQTYPDLFFALRGGGNNFGIVTRFDLETFPQGKMWGGQTIYPTTANTSIYKAFENFANNAPTDPDAALIVSAVLSQGQWIFGNDYEYAKPVVNPSIFHELTSIPNVTSSNRITTLSNLTEELRSFTPFGFRETYTTVTFKNNANLQTKVFEIFYNEFEKLRDVKDILPAMTMQPITKDMISNFAKRGGNPLGIAEGDGPLTLMNLAILWSNKSDDDRIVAAAGRVIDNTNSLAKSLSLDYKFIYQNYASLNQSVFAGYGIENQQRLIQISKKYDPDQVFQKLQPGYFKLSGVNGGSPT